MAELLKKSLSTSSSQAAEKLAEVPKKSGRTSSEMIDWALGRRSTDVELDQLDTAIKTETDVERIKQNPKLLEKTKNQFVKFERELQEYSKSLGSIVGMNKKSAESLLDDVVDKTTSFDKKKGIYRPKTLWEMTTENWNRRSGLWNFAKNMVVDVFAWNKVKKYMDALNLYKKGEVVTKAVKNTVQRGKDTVSTLSKTVKENPAVKQINMLVGKNKKEMRALFEQVRSGKISAEKFAKELGEKTKQTMKAGQKHPSEFIKAVKNGKLPGFTLATSGKLMMVEVLTRGVLEGFREGKFGAFTETITDSNVLVEAIPGVGSWKSLGRLFSDNGDNLGLKVVDAGLNVVGDGILLAGIAGSAFTFGASGAAALATRAGITSLGKGLIKSVTTKQGVKQLAKQGLKGGKSIAGWTAISSVAGYAIESAVNAIFKDGIIEKTIMSGLSEDDKAVFSAATRMKNSFSS